MTSNTFKLTIPLFILSLLLFACKTDNNLPDPLQAGWNNIAVCKLLEENENIRVLRCTFKPGVGHEKHYHKPHFGYTLAGSKFRMIDAEGTKEISVATGSSFYSEGTDWHEVLNIGDSTAIFLIIEPK
jgi:quercetin dioxygenase-like cupin family protein